MSVWSRLFACLTLTALTMGALVYAQEKDKPAKDDKKDEKKDDKKDDKKKDVEPEEKVVFGAKLDTKIKRFSEGAGKEFTIEVLTPDPAKIFAFKRWQAEQIANIGRSANPREYFDRSTAYKRELARRSANPLETNNVTEMAVWAGDHVKIRTMYLPLEYDDKGFPKKWTEKEKLARKDKTKLPGYPSEWDALRPGLFVQIYFAKVEAPKAGKKKLLDDDLDPKSLGSKAEAVMIVITGEAIAK